MVINQLTLYKYRNFDQYDLNLTRQNVVLHGRNGAGKTNILEALSLFSIGKGLKKASAQEIEHNQSQTGWSVHLRLNEDVILKTTYEKQLDHSFKRFSKAQNESVKNHADFAEWLTVLWITPETDRLFLDSPSVRRKFVDRFVYAQDVFHLKRVLRYEQATKERLKILKTYGHKENGWLDALEKTIAEEGIQIANARYRLLENLSTFVPNSCEVGILPGFKACMSGPFEEMFSSIDESSAFEKFLSILKENRQVDLDSGMTRFGPHRSDLFVWHPIKKINAFQCSTGEQKILLLSLLIAFIEQFCLHTNYLTVFLLDDVIAHLDEPHRFVLFNRLLENNNFSFQAWFSGTDESFFTPLKGHADFIAVSHSK